MIEKINCGVFLVNGELITDHCDPRVAGKDVKEAAKFIQGGGGGQPSLATAGGKNPDGMSAAMDALIASATK